MPGLLEIDEKTFDASFARESFMVRHHLGDHRLLTLDALGALADRLSESQVEHNVGALPEVVGRVEVERADLPPGEVARGIETNGCWMVLKNIETDPAYRALLDELLDEVVPLVERHEGPMTLREAFVFLSAPNSVTPSHIDPEHNFLLQVHGTKDMIVGRFPDSALEQRELEAYYTGAHRNLDWRPAGERTFPLAAGDGVYVPVHAPHVVRNGPTVSISLSITWRTPVTSRNASVHAVNARLRRLRLAPSPPGRRPGADRAKDVVHRAESRLRRLRRRVAA